jgi:hypothetical protein
MANKPAGASAVSAPGFDIPPGMEEAGTPELDGWFKARVGAVFYGQAVGRIVVPALQGGDRDVVLVKLTKPCESVNVDGSPDEYRTLEAGKVLGVGITHKLADLLNYVEKKGNVAVMCTEKKSIGQGKTLWLYKVLGEKGKRCAPPAPTASSSDVPAF